MRSAAPVGLCIAVALTATACTERPAVPWSGYVVGDFIYVAAPLAGKLEALQVRASDQVEQGAPLFSLESASELAAQDEAAAKLSGARAQQANLEKGKRSEEQAVIQAQLAQARVAAALAQRELERQQRLLDKGFVSIARVDDAATKLKEAYARVDELSASLKVARLPARSDELAASRASVSAAGNVLRQNEWRVEQKRQRAPAAGVINEVFFRQGEFVQAGQPVLSLLPPSNIKLRFFVPEAELGSLQLGQTVQIRCDGCGQLQPIAARISHIASQAEYTPPVIYSNSQRARLVFMVEAMPASEDAVRLHPGQPVDISRASAQIKAQAKSPTNTTGGR